MNDPVVIAILLGCAALIVFSIFARIRRKIRDAVQSRRRREIARQQCGDLETKQDELERLAGRIIATSSTDAIIGFALVRQIEAVFTDGHSTPAQAVLALKAVAAEKGANGIINLHSTRPPAGKCMAYGDAVIVKPTAEDAAPDAPAANTDKR
jgi:hypothetical protein